VHGQGAAHDSTSTVTAGYLTLIDRSCSIPLTARDNQNSINWNNAYTYTNEVTLFQSETAADEISLWYNWAADIYAFTDGTATATSAAQTFCCWRCAKSSHVIWYQGHMQIYVNGVAETAGVSYNSYTWTSFELGLMLLAQNKHPVTGKTSPFGDRPFCSLRSPGRLLQPHPTNGRRTAHQCHSLRVGQRRRRDHGRYCERDPLRPGGMRWDIGRPAG